MSISISDSYQNERVLVWSQRNIQNYIFNSCLYEFEDLIQSVDCTNLISPPQYNLWEKGIRKAIKNYTKYFKELAYTNPYFDRLYLDQKYDLFFSIIDFPYNLSSINLLKNWRKNCQVAVCYIIEIWHHDLPKLKNFIKFFQSFDLICLGHSQIVKDVEKIVGRPCIYLPPGVDAVKFHPHSQDSRAIDLCSLGRRSDPTHQALLKLAEQKNFFYYYDHIVGGDLRIKEYQAHRTLISNLLKNSRYFITNRAKVNEPEQTKGQIEIGYRFFEGAAAGNILLGCPPNNAAFKQYFDWESAVIPIPFDEPKIGNIIAELDKNPEQLATIRRNNVVNSLAKHDWVYRWEEVLNQVGMSTTPAMQKRKAYLNQLALGYQARA